MRGNGGGIKVLPRRRIRRIWALLPRERVWAAARHLSADRDRQQRAW
ncbi:hypothetical protein [Nocardia wallacei]|nr:hypothetical protein [Nocardia wallacei]